MAETRAEPRLHGWGRVADYLFGRNALIGVASFMLLILSGYPTWHGMRDFIIGVSSTPTSQGQSLPGGIDAIDDEIVDLPLALVVDSLVGVETPMVVLGLYLAGNVAFLPLCYGVETRDP